MRLTSGTTRSPSATASAPPGQKSFCTSMTISASAEVSGKGRPSRGTLRCASRMTWRSRWKVQSFFRAGDQLGAAASAAGLAAWVARARAASWFSAVLRAGAGALEAEDREGDEAAVDLEEGAPELAFDAGDGLRAAVLDEDVEDAARELGVDDPHPLRLAAAAEDGAALAGGGELLQLLERAGGGVALAGEAAGGDAGGHRRADGRALASPCRRRGGRSRSSARRRRRRRR